jgi:DNA-binding response OmpR family regulator
LLITSRLDAGSLGGGASPAEQCTILVVADEAKIADSLSTALQVSGHEVRRVNTGQSAEEAVRTEHLDLIVIDVILPDVDGLLVLSNLKVSHPHLRTIVVGRGQRRSDVVLALRLGADDFITAPFNANEFRARVDAVLRRASATEPSPPAMVQPPTLLPEAKFDALVLDATTGRASVDGVPLHLTPIEYGILAALVNEPGHLLSRQELMATIWGKDGSRHSRSLDVHVGRLRAKLRGLRVEAPSLVSVRIHAFRLVRAGGDPLARSLKRADDPSLVRPAP